MHGIQAAAAVAGLVAGLAGPALAIRPGDAAPDFALQDVPGTVHRLSDHRGQVVLLALIGYS